MLRVKARKGGGEEAAALPYLEQIAWLLHREDAMREVVSHHIRERHVTFTLELASTRQSAYVALPGIVEIQNTAYSIQHTGAPGFSRNRAQSGMSGIPLFSWQGV